MSLDLLPRGALLALSVTVAAVCAGCPESRSAGNPANVAAGNVALTAQEVEQILLRGVAEAQTLRIPVAIAVTDREGEVLGVFVTSPVDRNGDGVLETPGEAQIQGAISKAATASAFQSEGEAFTTRTAFFIVQGHYPPGVDQTAGGPLFGVQDSGQPGSDAHIIAWDQNGDATGTGISGVLGGVPLFKQGAPVGGVGVASVAAVISLSSPTDATLSPTLVTPIQDESDERIARAACGPFDTPPQIQATNVYVDGIGFPFYGPGPVLSPASIAATLSSIPTLGAVDARFPVRTSPLTPEQRVAGEFGIRPNHRYLGRLVARTNAAAFTNVDRPAAVTLDPNTLTFRNVPIANLPIRPSGTVRVEIRAPSIDGVEPPPAEGGLTAAEVDRVIDQAVGDAARSIAGIRLPRGLHVTVHVAVVDRRGNLLGLFRMSDGTLFSSDIAVQKARTAAFFSTDGTEGLPPLAMSARGVGFLSQPFFPPGIGATQPGPLVFLRDLINRGKITVESPPSLTLIDPPPRPPSDGTFDEDALRGGFQRFNDYGGTAPATLGQVRAILAAQGGIHLLMDRPDTTPPFVSPGLQSGLMTFPGGVPLYKNGRLVGGVGVSGDGVDEDDAAAFAGSTGFAPPTGVRCDEAPEGVILQVLGAKLTAIATAIQTHPDPRIRDVYGPVVQSTRNWAQGRLNSGLSGVRIPYVKLPRNPGKS